MFLIKDLFLIPIMLAVFVFGYFVMAKIDSFIEENRRLIHAENRQNRAHIRIAAESPTLLDSIAVQLELVNNSAMLLGRAATISVRAT